MAQQKVVTFDGDDKVVKKTRGGGHVMMGTATLNLGVEQMSIIMGVTPKEGKRKVSKVNHCSLVATLSD